MSIPPRLPTDSVAVRPVGALDLAPALVVGAEATLAEAAQMMVFGRVTALLVRRPGHDDAIVSEHDLTVALAAGRPPETRAVDVATPDPVVVDAGTPILEAVERMLDRGVRNLPVVDRRGKVIGMLALHEALRAVVGGAGSVPWLSALRLALHVELGEGSRSLRGG